MHQMWSDYSSKHFKHVNIPDFRCFGVRSISDTYVHLYQGHITQINEFVHSLKILLNKLVQSSNSAACTCIYFDIVEADNAMDHIQCAIFAGIAWDYYDGNQDQVMFLYVTDGAS